MSAHFSPWKMNLMILFCDSLVNMKIVKIVFGG